MPIVLRISLIVGALALAVLVLGGIRRSRMRIEDSLFWIALSFVILVLSIIPDIGYWLSSVFGVQAPVNFILLFFMAIMIAKCFSLAKQVSLLETKLKELAQQVAVDKLGHYERSKQRDRIGSCNAKVHEQEHCSSESTVLSQGGNGRAPDDW